MTGLSNPGAQMAALAALAAQRQAQQRAQADRINQGASMAVGGLKDYQARADRIAAAQRAAEMQRAQMDLAREKFGHQQSQDEVSNNLAAQRLAQARQLAESAEAGRMDRFSRGLEADASRFGMTHGLSREKFDAAQRAAEAQRLMAERGMDFRREQFEYDKGRDAVSDKVRARDSMFDRALALRRLAQDQSQFDARQAQQLALASVPEPVKAMAPKMAADQYARLRREFLPRIQSNPFTGDPERMDPGTIEMWAAMVDSHATASRDPAYQGLEAPPPMPPAMVEEIRRAPPPGMAPAEWDQRIRMMLQQPAHQQAEGIRRWMLSRQQGGL